MIADEILVKKAQNGDRAAYGELVYRYQDRIYGLAVRMLGVQDARDASQDIFIRAFRSLPGFDFRSAFATWLYRLATNACLDFLRRRGREALLGLSAGAWQAADAGKSINGAASAYTRTVDTAFMRAAGTAGEYTHKIFFEEWK